MAAKGNGVVTIQYSWLDIAPATGSNFYRIRSIWRDGKSSLSKVVLVITDVAEPSIVIYPNPITNQEMNVQLNEMKQGWYLLTLYNSHNQEITSLTLYHPGGSSIQKKHINTFLPAGIYYLRIKGNNFNGSRQVFVE